ncbi:MAG: hypothetical protein ACRC8S_06905 [Fimbriiglobus sp.]
MSAILPPALMRYLADASVEVMSWSAESGVLVLRIHKEIGPESGLLRFCGVVSVHLPPRFTIETLTAMRQGREDTMFEITGVWGESYMIVADSVEYISDAVPGTLTDRKLG